MRGWDWFEENHGEGEDAAWDEENLADDDDDPEADDDELEDDGEEHPDPTDESPAEPAPTEKAPEVWLRLPDLHSHPVRSGGHRWQEWAVLAIERQAQLRSWFRRMQLARWKDARVRPTQNGYPTHMYTRTVWERAVENPLFWYVSEDQLKSRLTRR